MFPKFQVSKQHRRTSHLHPVLELCCVHRGTQRPLHLPVRMEGGQAGIRTGPETHCLEPQPVSCGSLGLHGETGNWHPVYLFPVCSCLLTQTCLEDFVLSGQCTHSHLGAGVCYGGAKVSLQCWVQTRVHPVLIHYCILFHTESCKPAIAQLGGTRAYVSVYI